MRGEGRGTYANRAFAQGGLSRAADARRRMRFIPASAGRLHSVLAAASPPPSASSKQHRRAPVEGVRVARRDIRGAVDFGYLESFAAGDAEVIDEVLALFREQSVIWGSLLTPDHEGWRDAVHT